MGMVASVIQVTQAMEHIVKVHIFYFIRTSGQPVLRTECRGGTEIPPPPGSTEAIAFPRESESWPSIISMSIIDPTHPPAPRINRGNCFPCESESWLSIISVLIIDLPPCRMNRGDCLSTQKWKLTVDCLSVDHWSPPGLTEAIAFPSRPLIDPSPSLQIFAFLIFNIKISST